MEQEHATTFLIVWAQLSQRQHLLPVVPCEDGDDSSIVVGGSRPLFKIIKKVTKPNESKKLKQKSN